jgi:hypothetical protein
MVMEKGKLAMMSASTRFAQALAAGLLALVAGCGQSNGAKPKQSPGGQPTGAECTDASQCQSGMCTDGMCAACSDPTCAPTCSGQVCDTGSMCSSNSDCTTKVCLNGACQAPTPTDSVQNGDETDVDCGGKSAPPCMPRQMCSVGTDCSSKVCNGGTCAMPSSSDGVQNGNETDVDCGGTGNPTCADGRHCAVASDCLHATCIGGTCTTPSCTDQVKNGNETDVDCGGSCGKCGDHKHCNSGSDCTSKVCTGNVCQPPSCADGVQNGLESDIDCGGQTTCNRCGVGQKCTAHADCEADACDYKSQCTFARSCGAVNPGDGAVGFWGRVTCGEGEYPFPQSSSPEEKNNCCETHSVTGLPGVQMDRFVVTAGRMRTFLERLNYDVKSFVKSLPATTTTWNHAWDDKVPSSREEAFVALGPGNFDTHVRQGCEFASPYDGMRTYYWKKSECPSGQGFDCTTETAYGFPQYVYDMKTLNCVEVYVGAAFCAWDGGRLASETELLTATQAGGKTYPWGNQAPVGATPGVVGSGDHFSAFGKQYYWPNADDPNDSATPLVARGETNIHLIGIPGRYPMGRSVDMIDDLIGDVVMIGLKTKNANDGYQDFDSGDWEGATATEAILSKAENYAYWGAGIRCVHDQ